MSKGRPNDTQLELRIFKSTLALLKKVGYRQITIDAIATQAKTSRQTIYRKYGGLDKLIALATEYFYQDFDEKQTDNDDIQQQIIEHLNGTVKILTETEIGEVFRAIIPDIGNKIEFAQIADTVGKKRRTKLRQLMLQGQKEGLVKAQANVDVLIDGLMGAIYFHFLLTQRGLSRKYVRGLFEDLALG